MNELKDIYERITFLRSKGVKMKEMAAQTQITPSVFSAMYSSVLPVYLKNIESGMPDSEALDKALLWVNNLSKKKLLGILPQMKQKLLSMEAVPRDASDGNVPFLCELEQTARRGLNYLSKYCGLYTGYSLSSDTGHMKAEPFLIAPAANGSYIEVGYKTVRDTTHWGGVLPNGMSHLYLMFNGSPSPQLSLTNISLKLPLFERPPYLRGICQGLDVNFNPMARRILLVKQSDSTDRQTFLQEVPMLKPYEEANDVERIYYDYTCREEDVIRLCNIPAPRMTAGDLAIEKKILELENL